MAEGLFRMSAVLESSCKKFALTHECKRFCLHQLKHSVFGNGSIRWRSSQPLPKEATVAQNAEVGTKGTPYEELTVGIPKEIWKNETR